MSILIFKDFKEKNNLKKDTKIGIDLQRVHYYHIYPRDSKIYSEN